MILAAIENTTLLLLTLIVIIRIGFGSIYRQISKERLLIFSIVFSIFFSFSVGLTTSNFGALVRYKIPAVPFYASTILILYQRNKGKEKE
jgi:hypothetical protein